jgi:gamma-glutamylcyclotransferase (GGCT)/AIG2-like uncharacterized protein YtfP
VTTSPLTDEERDYLFVYGTLRKCPDRKGQRNSRCKRNHRMHHILAQYAAFAGKGTMRGRLFHIGEYPGAVLLTSTHDFVHDTERDIIHDMVDGIVDNAGDGVVHGEVVHGEIYALHNHLHYILRVLDEYEGCGPDDPQPTEFRRERVTIFLETGQEVSAWVYLYNRPTSELEVIPSGDYLKWLPLTTSMNHEP